MAVSGLIGMRSRRAKKSMDCASETTLRRSPTSSALAVSVCHSDGTSAPASATASSARSAQSASAGFWRLPLVGANEPRQTHRPAGFLQRLADGGIDNRLVGLEMAGRLVQHPAPADLFLHDQQVAVAEDHGGDGHHTPGEQCQGQPAQYAAHPAAPVPYHRQAAGPAGLSRRLRRGWR